MAPKTQRNFLFFLASRNFNPRGRQAAGRDPEFSRELNFELFKSLPLRESAEAGRGVAARPGPKFRRPVRRVSAATASRGPGFSTAPLQRTRRCRRRDRNPGAAELRTPYRTVRGPRRSRLLRAWWGHQERSWQRMRKGPINFVSKARVVSGSLRRVGNRFTKKPKQRKTNRQFRREWRQIRSRN